MNIEQYITKGILTDKEDNDPVYGEIYVNNPLRYNGHTFYQHSLGSIIMLGLFLAFYIRPKELIIKSQGDRLYVYGSSPLNIRNKNIVYKNQEDILI